MTFWNTENLKTTLGGTWLAKTEETVTGLCTDSRTLKPGQAFLALKGDTFDGHTMLGAAAKAGSPLAIIDSVERASVLPTGMAVLKVADTRRSLLRLAAAYRKTLDRTRVIAVGGSNGKTTTVRLITAALSSAMKGTASQKSFNNDIGVPLTILSASPSDQYLICEVGTNAPGEISTLAAVVQPDIGVITSIGREHLEKLGSLRGVAREEASLLEHIRPGGAGFISADALELREVLGTLSSRPAALLSFGFDHDSDVGIARVEQSLTGMTFTLNDRAEFKLPLLGRHNAANAAAAIAVARRMGLPDAAIAEGLATAKGESMRLEVSHHSGVCIINDAYNANPDSMRASLETFDAVAKHADRRIVVLGDMLELGEYAAASHREVVEAVASRPHIAVAVLVGPQMKAAASPLSKTGVKVIFGDDLNEPFAAQVAKALQPGDAVLLKGSRRMRLERLIPAVKARPVMAHA